MSSIRILMFFVMLSFAFASVSFADSVQYVVLGPSGVADCTFSAGPGSYTVFANLELTAPAKALEVSAPQSCGGTGITWSYPVSGDPNTVLTVDFGGCISGTVPLFSAQFDVYGCCPMLLNGPIESGPSQTSPPVLIGCDDERRFLIPPCSAASPSLLTPANGQTGVSPTPFLSWDYQYIDYCQEGIGLAIFTIYYGTDPDNLDQSLCTLDTPQWTLPMLDFNTQYFWRIKVWDDWAYYAGSMINFSEIRSFTTAETVPVERTTWGVVKAFYQD